MPSHHISRVDSDLTYMINLFAKVSPYRWHHKATVGFRCHDVLSYNTCHRLTHKQTKKQFKPRNPVIWTDSIRIYSWRSIIVSTAVILLAKLYREGDVICIQNDNHLWEHSIGPHLSQLCPHVHRLEESPDMASARDLLSISNSTKRHHKRIYRVFS